MVEAGELAASRGRKGSAAADVLLQTSSTRLGYHWGWANGSTLIRSCMAWVFWLETRGKRTTVRCARPDLNRSWLHGVISFIWRAGGAPSGKSPE